MDTLLTIVLTNAVLATVLALGVGLLGCVCKRPAVLHALWLLVLLKLLTPPVVNIPIAWTNEAAPPSAMAAAPSAMVLEPASIAAEPPDASPDGPADTEPAGEPFVVASPESVPEGGLEAPGDGVSASTSESVASANEPAVLAHAESLLSAVRPWAPILLGVWLTGTILWLALLLYRSVRFHRLLRYAREAPADLQQQTAWLADRLGLSQRPQVLLLPGSISPMLWTLAGPPRLLLPRDLLKRLNADQRATLLAHELAHLYRCDHWVRILELAATALFWWHPVVWWARHELREAEEQCCDAWVVWAIPGAARSYATALVETLDFLADARPVLPPAASGIGQVTLLKRRLTMIMQGKTPRAVSALGILAILGLGAMLLSSAPSLSYGQPPRDREREEREEKERRAREEKTRNYEREVMQAEWEKARAEVKAAEARLAAAKARLEEIEAKAKAGQRDDRRPPDGGGRPGGPGMPPAGGGGPPGGEGGRGFGGGFGGGFPGGGGFGGGGRFGPGQSPDQRMQDIEKKLDAVMKELENLRKELRRGPGPVGPGGPDKPGRGPGGKPPGDGRDRDEGGNVREPAR